MKLLIVKLTSMGDVVHALPALTDACGAIPDLSADWVCDEGFDAIPGMHPGVRKVIVAPIRRWRRSASQAAKELPAFINQLREEKYDRIIDAQGLLKSAIVALLAKGVRYGFDSSSAREPIAAFLYNRNCAVKKDLHAIARLRQLFASSLGYALPETPVDHGLPQGTPEGGDRRVIFIHGTTWASKHWPEPYWCALARLAATEGYRVLLPHGNDLEKARAETIAAVSPSCTVMPRVSVAQLYETISHSGGVVTVDSGLGHLAVAAKVPLVGLYGATDPALTGTFGSRATVLNSDHLPCIPCRQRECRFERAGRAVFPPCFEQVTPERVWSELMRQFQNKVTG